RPGLPPAAEPRAAPGPSIGARPASPDPPVAPPVASRPVYDFLKRLIVGRPLAGHEEHTQLLPKTIALATFSSDAISSTAYATEEILFVVAAGTSSLALGLSKLV